MHRLGDVVDVRLVEAQPVAGALRFELLSDGQLIPRGRKRDGFKRSERRAKDRPARAKREKRKKREKAGGRDKTRKPERKTSGKPKRGKSWKP
jgi:ribonuclease R